MYPPMTARLRNETPSLPLTSARPHPPHRRRAKPRDAPADDGLPATRDPELAVDERRPEPRLRRRGRRLHAGRAPSAPGPRYTGYARWGPGTEAARGGCARPL